MNTFYGKEAFPRNLIDYIDSIYVTELQEEAPAIENKNQETLPSSINTVTISVPMFQQEVEIHAILKTYFPKEHQATLLSLLQGQTIKEKLLFLGRANQLADIFRKLLDNHLITGCLQKELITWVMHHFEYRNNKGQTKALTERAVHRIISGNQHTCMNPIIKITKDAVSNSFIFTDAPRVGKKFEKI